MELFPILFKVSIFKSPDGGFFVSYNLSKHSQASQAQPRHGKMVTVVFIRVRKMQRLAWKNHL